MSDMSRCECKKCIHFKMCAWCFDAEHCAFFQNKADVVLRKKISEEIFEEIEKTLNRKIARSKPQFEKLHCDEKDLSIWGYKDMGYFQGIISTCEDLQDLIAELKKKYTEGQI